MTELSIGQVAKMSGIGVETIRFYERKGLIDEPPRKTSGYRQYDETAVTKLAFIQQAKTLGFSLKEIGELLSLREKPGSTSREIKRLAEAKLCDIKDKMEMLGRMQRTLENLVEQCPGKGPLSHCPILEAIETGAK